MSTNTEIFLNRLARLMPPGTQPRFRTVGELMAWHGEQALIESERITEQNQRARFQKVLGRSGIQALHQSCSFDNYHAELPGQRKALEIAKRFARYFGKRFGGFIFSGGCGTGKNHLAAAIGNDLLRRGKSVLVVTVPDLMMRFRETYEDEKNTTEAELMNDLCSVDLLILDDIGVQRGNVSESVVLFQIIDRRLSNKKPVGMLTNLGQEALTALLTERIMDRMRMDGGVWVNFDWQSYRKQVKS